MNEHDGDISSIESISAPPIEPRKMNGFTRNWFNQVRVGLQNRALHGKKEDKEDALPFLLMIYPIEVGSPLLPIKLELSMEDLRERADLYSRWVLSGQPVYEES